MLLRLRRNPIITLPQHSTQGTTLQTGSGAELQSSVTERVSCRVLGLSPILIT